MCWWVTARSSLCQITERTYTKRVKPPVTPSHPNPSFEIHAGRSLPYRPTVRARSEDGWTVACHPDTTSVRTNATVILSNIFQCLLSNHGSLNKGDSTPGTRSVREMPQGVTLN